MYNLTILIVKIRLLQVFSLDVAEFLNRVLFSFGGWVFRAPEDCMMAFSCSSEPLLPVTLESLTSKKVKFTL